MCSRRDAEKLITEGRVTINGKPTQLGNRVHEKDKVAVDGRVLQAKPKTLYIAFNKPVGVVCTTDSKEKKNIVKYIGHPERLFPIGRLDKPSDGLIFLTNDGDIVNKILRAGNNHEKEYVVSVDKPITADFVQKMSSGIPILGTVTKKCKVVQTGPATFTIVLVQGLNRQIRRMSEHLGYEVTKLQRTRIMNVSLGKLQKGDWRELTLAEMKEINQMIASSSKTAEASEDVQKKSKPSSEKKKGAAPTQFNRKSATFRKKSSTSKRNTSGSFRKRNH